MKTWKLPSLRLCMAFALCSVFTLSNAQAQMRVPCAERTDMVKLLADRYKEVPRAVGIASRNGVMEVYVSKKGTWSVLMTNTSGKACIIAAGDAWEDMEVAFLEPEA